MTVANGATWQRAWSGMSSIVLVQAVRGATVIASGPSPRSLLGLVAQVIVRTRDAALALGDLAGWHTNHHREVRGVR